jgi:hypothetical protein
MMVSIGATIEAESFRPDTSAILIFVNGDMPIAVIRAM